MNAGNLASEGMALRIQTASMELEARLVPWDTESFGVRVAQVERFVVHDHEGAAEDARALQEWLIDEDIALASCRLPHDALVEAMVAEDLGFRFVEMVYAMSIDADQLKDDPALSGLKWDRATPADLSALRELAATAFLTGRWNVDPRVGNAMAGKRYADWVSRSLHDPNHQVLVARVDDAVAGLFVVEESMAGAPTAYWHLTAVAPAFQGRGWGRRLWTSMLSRHADRHIRVVRTTISARNIPVVNLYSRLGWRFDQCLMTSHWVRPHWRVTEEGSAC